MADRAQVGNGQIAVNRPRIVRFCWNLVDSCVTAGRNVAERRLHITPILRQLHWRVTFKIAVLVFQCLTGQAPAYLADDCQLTSDVSTHRLRSTDTAMCVVRRSNNSFGDRCFAAAGPRLWNTLPVHLRQCDSLGQIKRLLKTHLFGVWDRGTLWRLS